MREDASPGSPGSQGSRLPRTLSTWQAIGLSMALMAPSMAANINPQGTERSVGRAVPLAFLLAGVTVLLVAYVFVRLCQHFHSAGSVYAFVGAALGPRTGLVAGWCLLGAYILFGVVTSSAAGVFGIAFLQGVGVWERPVWWSPFLLVAVVLVAALVLSVSPAKRGTRVLLTVEGVTVALILVVSTVVLVRLIAGSAPEGQRFTLEVFRPQPGTSWSELFLGVVFGFLSFAGFEAAATLGEEAAEPRRAIPRAILATAVFGGLYFTFVTAVEVMGFGVGKAGLEAFAASSSLLGDLGETYVGSWVGDCITLGTTVSAFGCCLASMVGASRVTYTLFRDGAGNRGPGRLSATGTPGVSAALIAGVMGFIIVVCATVFSARPMDTFLWSGTVGTLLLLVAYALTTVGGIWLLFIRRVMPVAAWQIVFPLGALAILGYTLYRSVFPYPASGAARWFPVVSGTWVLVAIVAVLAAPAWTRRMGSALAEHEGITAESPRET
ncbi:APC family permease [Streptomyces sp. NEAU-Y11]|uniref:APC family permease n=1 Tax=Streptomyces cucumeris TaxID=2962890 RepID=UPI0020C8BC56|nr:APC family permease [Streptomyces sp. NEAU-Y11]MCP9211398.1 APC family permease [Streptomyces sp. NEAU-Y11]